MGVGHAQHHTIDGFHGAGGEQTHQRAFVIEADHPAVLVGEDHAPTPAEHLLQALGACLMSGLAQHRRGSRHRPRRRDRARRGRHRPARDLRAGRLRPQRLLRHQGPFEVAGDADAAQLERLVQQAVSRSAVYDIITHGVPSPSRRRATPELTRNPTCRPVTPW